MTTDNKGLFVAYYVPHNEGVVSGVISEPGQNTGMELVDLYEVDAQIAGFATDVEARAWLTSCAAARR